MRFKNFILAVIIGLVGSCSSVLALDILDRNDFFTPSVRFRTEYDDNIYTTEDDETASWKFIVEPKIELKFDFPQDVVSLDYKFGYRYYTHSPHGKDHEFDHNANFNWSHEFDPRCTLFLKNTFVYDQEPEAVDNNVVLQREGNYYYNRGSVGLAYNMTEMFVIRPRYYNEYLHYVDDFYEDQYDRFTNAVGADIDYLMNPTTSPYAGYLLLRTDWKENHDRDYWSHRVYGGVKHRFSKMFYIDGKVGYEYRDFKGYGNFDSPFANISLTTTISPMTNFTVGYFIEIDNPATGDYKYQQRQKAYVHAEHKFTRRLAVFARGSYDHGRYNRSSRIEAAARDGKQETWEAAVGLSYEFKDYLFAEAGYNYIDVDTDVSTPYDRNRVYMGVNLIF